MNRRQLIKRSIVGSLAALVGLPEVGKAKDFDRAARAKECADIVAPHYRNSLPIITHTGKFRLYRKTGLICSGSAWNECKCGAAMYAEIFNLCLTEEQRRWVSRGRPVRLSLVGEDYEVVAVGSSSGYVGYTWKDGDYGMRISGNFNFRLEEPFEEIVVKKRFPSDQDKGDIWGNGSLRIYNPGDVVMHNGSRFVAK